MIKKLSFLLLSFYAFIFAQQNPSVELPDFIITGTDIVSIKSSQKISPEFVSTISDQFFKPVYSPEELLVRDISSPLKNDLSGLDSLNFQRGKLDFGAGIYSLPTASLVYLFPINNVLAEAIFTGENHRPHIGNTARYLINGGLNLLYTTNNSSEVLPGTQFKFNGEFGSSSYKFYSISNPPKRTLNQGNFTFGISNQLSRQFNFDLRVIDELSSISEENYSENIFGLNLFSKVIFSSFNIAVSAEYKNQSLTINDTPANIPNSDVNDFFTVKPSAGLNISDAFKVSGGISYSKSGERSFTAPFAALSFKINNSFSLFGEYSPHAEFLSSNDFLKINRYYETQNFYNHFYRKRNFITAVVKYEYDKYYQVNAGIKYFSSPAYPYFVDSISTGRFSFASADANSITFFADLFFHLGPYGVMYGNIEFNDTKDNSDRIIPYHPQIRASALYGYEFDFGLRSEIKLSYFSKAYTDIVNIESENTPSHFDLGLRILYKVVDNFYITGELNNIFNNDIYFWKGYKETPLDLMGGFRLLW